MSSTKSTAVQADGPSTSPKNVLHAASRGYLPSSTRMLQLVFWCGVAAVTFLGTFVVQFLLPLKQPVYSPAYTAGANNRVGAIMAALTGCIVTLMCLRYRFGSFKQKPALDGQPLPRKYLYGALAAVVAVVTMLGVLILRGGYYYADSGYFLTQLRSGIVLHRHLYTEVEFAYGPFLYLWPAAFAKAFGVFGWSLDAAYLSSLIVMEAIGTWLLFYTVSAMPLSRRMKIGAFVSLLIITLDPQEGLNYTAFRFILPALGVVLLSRQRSPGKASLLVAACAAANFAVSPELGFAFTAASVVLGFYRTFLLGRRWVWVAVTAIAGSAVLLLLAGSAYLHTLREFAKGGYNMILEPVPHIYLLLICAAALAPAVVADAIRQENADRGERVWRQPGMLLGLYIAGLALLPAALGRCDPLHVAYNGWPLYLLSFAALDRLHSRWKVAGVTIAILFSFYSVAQECALGSKELRGVLTQRKDPNQDIDLPRLQQMLQGRRVSFPFNKPLPVIDALAAAGEYQPTYLCVPPVDAAADARTIQDMQHAEYVAVPGGIKLVTQNPINNKGIKFHMRLNYVYQQRRAPFYQNQAEMQELAAHWHPAGKFGSYVLYARNS